MEARKKQPRVVKAAEKLIDARREPDLKDKSKKGLEGAVLDAQAHDELERSFEKVLKELEHEKGLKHFRTLYEEVLCALRRSHDNERRLALKCKQLKDEDVAAAARVTAALRLGEEDQNTIVTLRKELEKTWKQISASHSRETKLRADLADVKLAVEAAQQQAEQHQEHESAVSDLLKHKQELIQERDTQLAEILALRQGTEQLRNQISQKEQQCEEAEAALAAVRTEAAGKRAEQERHGKARERMEKEIHELKTSLNARHVELQGRAAEVKAAEARLRDYQQELRESNATAESLRKEASEIAAQGSRLQKELEAQTAAVTQLAADNAARASALKTAAAEAAGARVENARLARANEASATKLRRCEERAQALEVTRDELRAKVQALERERQEEVRAINLLEQKTAAAQQEREVLSKLKANVEGSSHHQMQLVKVHEGHIKALQAELAAHKTERLAAAEQQAALRRELESLAAQGRAAATKLASLQEQLEEKTHEVDEAQDLVAELEQRLAAEGKLCEKLRTDNSKAAQEVAAARGELSDARAELARKRHEMGELRTELKQRGDVLAGGRAALTRAEAEGQTLAHEVGRLEATLAGSRADADALQTEIRAAQAAATEAAKEKAGQLRERSALTAERDALSSKLVRRGEEVALLTAKLRLQTSELQAGHAAYEARLAELRTARRRVSALQTELAAARRRAATAAALRREVQLLGRRMSHERAKCCALSRELETPLNVHRWRKLEGSDPAAYQLVQKVQLLQKRLLRAAEQLVERELQIQQGQATCAQLQAVVSRCPGPEAAQQLSLAKAALRKKAKQLQALQGERDMRHAQCAEQELSMSSMRNELATLKGQLFIEKEQQPWGSSLGGSGATIEEITAA